MAKSGGTSSLCPHGAGHGTQYPFQRDYKAAISILIVAITRQKIFFKKSGQVCLKQYGTNEHNRGTIVHGCPKADTLGLHH